MDPVLSRRSTREYTDQPVSDEMVRMLLKAAMQAPSAGDERPWHFVVIRDRRVRERIPEIHRFAPLNGELAYTAVNSIMDGELNAHCAVYGCGDVPQRLQHPNLTW